MVGWRLVVERFKTFFFGVILCVFFCFLFFPL